MVLESLLAQETKRCRLTYRLPEVSLHKPRFKNTSVAILSTESRNFLMPSDENKTLGNTGANVQLCMDSQSWTLMPLKYRSKETSVGNQGYICPFNEHIKTKCVDGDVRGLRFTVSDFTYKHDSIYARSVDLLIFLQSTKRPTGPGELRFIQVMSSSPGCWSYGRPVTTCIIKRKDEMACENSAGYIADQRTYLT